MNFEQDLLERSLYWRHKYHCHILYMRIPPICSFYRTSNSHTCLFEVAMKQVADLQKELGQGTGGSPGQGASDLV